MADGNNSKFFKGDKKPVYNEENNYGMDFYEEEGHNVNRQYENTNFQRGSGYQSGGGGYQRSGRGGYQDERGGYQGDRGRYQGEDGYQGDNRYRGRGGGRGGSRGGSGGGGRGRGGKRQKSEFYSEQSYNQEEINTDLYKNDEEGDDLILPIEKFEDMGLSEKILRGVIAYGFTDPSLVQQRAIRPFLAGRDVIAQAQSGMGKTATFCLGILSRIDQSKNSTQAVILAHSHELAQQIDMVLRQLGHYTEMRYNLSIGGINIMDNVNSLKKSLKPHIVIGTPGRILDLIGKRALYTKGLTMFVIDEADEMLSGKMQDQIKNIINSLPQEAQIGLYSATMNNEFFEVASKFMNKPVNILVKNEELTLDGIKQYYINVEKNSFKFDTLCDIYGSLSLNQIIIYCNEKDIVDRLTLMLRENDFQVSAIHSDMSGKDREETMSNFRNCKTRVLVSTDLTGRGIDVQQVSVVINYDIPNRIESYIHRIGRSGRYGRKGVAINFITNYDIKKMQKIEQYYHTMIDEMIDPEKVSKILSGDS